MPTARTARERVRDEVTREILDVARAHLARDGAAALSLRSIARDLEMAPSALYRYFDGRDVLLSALIVSAYASVADRAEQASEAARKRGEVDAAWWMAVPRAMRAWGLSTPYEWGLIFGSPVPGYRAPQETIVPYTRLASAYVRPVAAALAAGRLAGAGAALAAAALEAPTPEVPEGLEAALAPVREVLLPGAPVQTVQQVLVSWVTVVGAISLELFGHWHNTVLDPELFFEQSMRDEAYRVGLRS
jgi:AcrR family transcriptional regulator